MNVMQDKVLLSEAAAAVESQPMTLLQESSLVLQVSGGATALSLKALGTANDPADKQAVWVELGILNMSDFTVLQAVEKAGVYTVAVDGMRGFKVNLGSVSGGTVTVYGRAGA